MPVFKVQFLRRGECEIEAATPGEATAIVTSLYDSGDACVSLGDLVVQDVDQLICSVEEFVKLCEGQDADDIWAMIEEQLSSAVHEELYAIARQIDPDTPEPIRAAVNELGERHNVQTMKEF